MHVPPKEVCPFSAQQSLDFPTSLPGLQQQVDKKSQSPVTNSQHTREQFLENLSPGENAHGPDNPPLRQQISHLERMLTGLTTHLFDNKYLSPGENAHGPDNPPLRQQILWLQYGKPLFQDFLAETVMVILPQIV
jgi:hypothetical protein